MTDKQPQSNQNPTEEVDLGHLFQMINNVLNGVFRGFLRLFLYLKKNALMLLGLVVLGVVLAVILNNSRPKELKTEVIVKPNFESKEYLYGAVQELQSKISNRDTLFFKEIGVNPEGIDRLRIEINPIKHDSDNENFEEDFKYLQLIKDFSGDFLVGNIFKNEILEKSVVNYRITFYYKDSNIGYEQAKKLMGYIEANPYFNELKETHIKNAIEKITSNKMLINQVDELISGFSANLENKEVLKTESMVFLDNNKALDIPNLLNLKNNLLKENERKKLEILQWKEVIRILNFGRSHVKERTLFNERIVKYPLFLLGAFFLFSFLRSINDKAQRLEL